MGNQLAGGKWLRKEYEEVRDSNGTRIINLCIHHDFFIGHRKLTHRNVFKNTRQEISRNERSIIDHFLIVSGIWKSVKKIPTRKGVQSAEVFIIW